MATAVKICGLTDDNAVRAVIAAKADYAGFVYFPSSPRHLPIDRATALKAQLPSAIQSVAVLVDPEDALIDQIRTQLKPDFLQLHGKETPERIQAIRKTCPAIKVIKAMPVSTGDDIAAAMRYGHSVDMFLFDAKPAPGMPPGGNALSFEWALLKGREFPKPWMLSGGLNPDNVAEAIRKSGASQVDVSSGVERERGVKDAALIHAFIKAARSA